MKLVGRPLLKKFLEEHPDAEKSLASCIKLIETATWKIPQDVTNTITKASILKGCSVILNINNNAYRLEVLVSYATGVVNVVWIGTHEEYDERNNKGN